MPKEDKAPAWALDDDDAAAGPPAKSTSSYAAASAPSSYNKPSSYSSSYPAKGGGDDGEDDFDFSKPSSGATSGKGTKDEEEGEEIDFSKPSSDNKNNQEDDEGADAWGAPVKEEPKNDPQQLLMDQFYKDVEAIKTDIDKLKTATKRILDLMEKILASTSEVTDRTLNNDMRQTVDDTNKVAKNTKNLLALLKEENIKYKKDKKIESSNMRCVSFFHSLLGGCIS
jgi:hypothetical protein